jgi:hypothetical protein
MMDVKAYVTDSMVIVVHGSITDLMNRDYNYGGVVK